MIVISLLPRSELGSNDERGSSQDDFPSNGRLIGMSHLTLHDSDALHENLNNLKRQII